MKVRTYDHRHPLVASRTGDPARGSWAPTPRRKPRRFKRRKTSR